MRLAFRFGMNVPRRSQIFLFALLALVALAIAAFFYVAGRGFSARDRPTFVEAAVARRLRHIAVPRAQRTRTNPVPKTPDVIRAGLEHFADHCAMCHANDGSGDTEIGRNLYPKAPDMRAAATQDLSDAELFYIIENGVRLTGMPAWGNGTPEGEKASWTLVRFIRHLPQLTQEELALMQSLNPRPPSEMNMPTEEEFLKGETPEVQPSPPHHPKRGKG